MARSRTPEFIRAYPMNSLIIAVNIAVFVLTLLKHSDPLGAILSPDSRVLTALGSSYPPRIWEGEYWRFLSAMALHGGIIHLFFNCYVILVFCTMIERELGGPLYLACYVASGIGATAVSVLLSPYGSVGASGAVFGIIGIVLAHHYRRERSFDRFFDNPVVRSLMTWILMITLIGFFLNVDHFGHFGGLAFGFGLGLTLPTMRGAGIRWGGVAVFVLVLAGMVVAAAYPKDLEARGEADRLTQEGVGLLNLGDYDGAIQKFDECEEKGYHSRDLYYFRALARERNGAPDDAHVDYTRALEQDPDYLEARIARARVLVELGKPEEAIPDLERALELAPEGGPQREAVEAALKKLREGPPGGEEQP